MKMVARPFPELTVGSTWCQTMMAKKKKKKNADVVSGTACSFLLPLLLVVSLRLLTLLSTPKDDLGGNIFITLSFSPTPTEIPGFVFSLTDPNVISSPKTQTAITMNQPPGIKTTLFFFFFFLV